jgi:predicted transcriptional regulator
LVIQVIDEADEPTIKKLVELGLRRDVSDVIVFLDNVEESSAKEIERGTGRRVTEVSRALRTLRKRDWICETRHTQITNGKRVPYFRNSLSLEIDEIIEELERAIIRKQSACG